MSIGIPRAVDADGRPFDRWAIDDEPQPFTRPLSCGGCESQVGPVRRYTRRNGTVVEPLYRLGKGVNHDDGCVYDFDAQVGRLQRRNVGVVERDGDFYVLVLNVPPDDDQVSTTEAVGDPRGRLDFKQTASPPLNPTLRAASEIVKLLRKFEHDPEAKVRFRARYGGRVLAWDDFCFDAAHDLKRLYAAVSTAALDDHPRAVVGRVDHVRERDGAIYLAVREPDASTRAPVKAGDGIPITPVLRPGDGPAPRSAVDDVIVGYGIWVPWTPASGKPHYITLWLNDHRAAVATL